jgi:hypothetical protein
VSGKALMIMLQRPGEAIALMVDEVEKQGFDGLVGTVRSLQAHFASVQAFTAWLALARHNLHVHAHHVMH